MKFEDHFSELATKYARYRPGYPGELFEYLASFVPAHDLAWDCGTGNGQAALELARHFDLVVATDASEEQIDNASAHPSVDYRVEPAEDTSLGTGKVDLVAVGTAVHWFDFDSFYTEVKRVGKPRSVIAVWTYHFPKLTELIDRVVKQYYWQTLDGYWPEELRYLEQHYRTLPFPFDEIEPQRFSMRASWSLEKFVGFMFSWSGTKKLIEDQGESALQPMLTALESAWGEPDRHREVEWPLHIRMGRIHGDEAHSSGQPST